jgi:hypothetical protein
MMRDNIPAHLGFVVPCIFKYSIKQPTRCTINLKFIVLSRTHRSTCFGPCCAHHQDPPPTAFAAIGYRMIAGLDVLQAVVGLLVNRPQLEACPTWHSYGTQWLQRQLEGAPDDGHNSKPTTAWNTSNPAIIRKPEAAKAVGGSSWWWAK